MSKRFPIPEFDRDQFKNLEWSPLTPLAADAQQKLMAAWNSGDAGVCGGYPVAAPDAFFDRFSIRGQHRVAILCLLPKREVTLLGRSFAWKKQLALIVDSLDPASVRPLHEWRTPRPMNTRLGPEDGVKLEGGAVYAVLAHRYADHFVGNRTMVDNDWPDAPGGRGFRVMSSSDDRLSDFHHANLFFSWQA